MPRIGFRPQRTNVIKKKKNREFLLMIFNVLAKSEILRGISNFRKMCACWKSSPKELLISQVSMMGKVQVKVTWL